MSTLIYSYLSDLVQIHYKLTGMSELPMKFITKVFDVEAVTQISYDACS